MTEKQTYWIRDVEGNFAQVEGAEARDLWTKVHGWSDADEPGPVDQVYVVHERPEVRAGRLPYAAVPDWSGLGWKPGPPPEPADTSLHPALVDRAPKPPAAAPATSAKPATSGDKKE